MKTLISKTLAHIIWTNWLHLSRIAHVASFKPLPLLTRPTCSTLLETLLWSGWNAKATQSFLLKCQKTGETKHIQEKPGRTMTTLTSSEMHPQTPTGWKMTSGIATRVSFTGAITTCNTPLSKPTPNSSNPTNGNGKDLSKPATKFNLNSSSAQSPRLLTWKLVISS